MKPPQSQFFLATMRVTVCGVRSIGKGIPRLSPTPIGDNLPPSGPVLSLNPVSEWVIRLSI